MWAQIQQDWCPYKRGDLDPDVHTGRKPCAAEAEMSWCFYRQRGAARGPPGPGGGEGQTLLHGLRRRQPCRHLNLGILDAELGDISICCWRHPLCGTSSGRPQQTCSPSPGPPGLQDLYLWALPGFSSWWHSLLSALTQSDVLRHPWSQPRPLQTPDSIGILSEPSPTFTVPRPPSWLTATPSLLGLL